MSSGQSGLVLSERQPSFEARERRAGQSHVADALLLQRVGADPGVGGDGVERPLAQLVETVRVVLDRHQLADAPACQEAARIAARRDADTGVTEIADAANDDVPAADEQAELADDGRTGELVEPLALGRDAEREQPVGPAFAHLAAAPRSSPSARW